MPKTFTDEELAAHEKKLRDEARQQAESELVNGTTWKSGKDLLESAQNADRRIQESVSKEREALQKVKTLEDENKKLKETSGGGSKEDKKETPAEPDAVLATMTDAEEKGLGELLKVNASLKQLVKNGGKVEMAKALAEYRKMHAGTDTGTDDDNPFAAVRKTLRQPLSLEEELRKADEAYRKKHRLPVGPNAGSSQRALPATTDELETRPVRGGGGMREFAADGTQE